jgi:hypothetical protein
MKSSATIILRNGERIDVDMGVDEADKLLLSFEKYRNDQLTHGILSINTDIRLMILIDEIVAIAVRNRE